MSGGDAASGRPIGEPFEGKAGSAQSVAYAADGRLVAAGTNLNTLGVWDTATGTRAGLDGAVVTITTPKFVDSLVRLQRGAGVEVLHHDLRTVPRPMTAEALVESGSPATLRASGGRYDELLSFQSAGLRAH